MVVGAQAGQCGRCRGELGVAGRVCQHCRLDEQFVGWEVRIYSLQTHAMAAGQAVTAEEAIIRVNSFLLRVALLAAVLSQLTDPDTTTCILIPVCCAKSWQCHCYVLDEPTTRHTDRQTD